VERLAILPRDVPKAEEIKIFKASQPTRLQLKTQRTRSATMMDRWVTLLFNAATHVLAPNTIIYFSTTAQPTSQREGGSASESLKDLKMQDVIESLSYVFMFV
jgi:hypothetical protein